MLEKQLYNVNLKFNIHTLKKGLKILEVANRESAITIKAIAAIIAMEEAKKIVRKFYKDYEIEFTKIVCSLQPEQFIYSELGDEVEEVYDNV